MMTLVVLSSWLRSLLLLLEVILSTTTSFPVCSIQTFSLLLLLLLLLLQLIPLQLPQICQVTWHLVFMASLAYHLRMHLLICGWCQESWTFPPLCHKSLTREETASELTVVKAKATSVRRRGDQLTLVKSVERAIQAVQILQDTGRLTNLIR